MIHHNDDHPTPTYIERTIERLPTSSCSSTVTVDINPTESTLRPNIPLTARDLSTSRCLSDAIRKPSTHLGFTNIAQLISKGSRRRILPTRGVCRQCMPAFNSDDGEEEETEEEGESRGSYRTVPIPKDDLWDNMSSISYSFIRGHDNQRHKVKEVIEEIKDYVNLTLSYTPSGGDIRISFTQSSPSWSFVGSQARHVPTNEPTLNLNCINTEEGINPTERSVILHQLAHALGLLHEQQPSPKFQLIQFTRPDEKRPNSVSWETKEIPNPARIFHHSALSQYSRKTTPIMYFIHGNVSSDRKANKLRSEVDLAHLILLYPPSAGVPIMWALDTTGVGGRARNLIFSTQHPDNIRSTFLRWSDDDPTPKFWRIFFRLF